MVRVLLAFPFGALSDLHSVHFVFLSCELIRLRRIVERAHAAYGLALLVGGDYEVVGPVGGHDSRLGDSGVVLVLREHGFTLLLAVFQFC